MQQPPKEPDSGQDPVSHADLDQTPEEILEYWTKERMDQARPRELKLPAPGPGPVDQEDHQD
ncbi:hypothetical protein AB0284_07620 [Pseudarthrobacter phenanthrenivorans]|uniref:Uncharacterized protein n=1 Tax=Pseudarthrobacter phenanthrenivorans TaxID=361575 RepID=A0A0B4D0M4_PSEPS|nr:MULTISPECIES: hypothetical protein [Micrococcaceae]KIC66989.1 hypothetical protein RM50_09740 [Pseudarthrobacter phenanthrenivorans]MDJ0457118.1 hypothetical protein [Arthrobacter sp. NQ7]